MRTFLLKGHMKWLIQLFMDTMTVLASYPPKYVYKCPVCGWVGYSHNKVTYFPSWCFSR